MDYLICLLLAAIPLAAKTLTLLASAARPSMGLVLLDAIEAPACMAIYSILYLASAVLSLFFQVPPALTIGAMLGLIPSTLLVAMYERAATPAREMRI